MNYVDRSGNLDRPIAPGGFAGRPSPEQNAAQRQRVELANLRRARCRCHKKLKQTEALMVGYQAKLIRLEAAIHAIDPQLALPPRFHVRSTVFAQGEFTRLILEVLRGVPEPLSMRGIAIRMLAAKGHFMPDKALRKQTFYRLSQALCVHRDRGMVEMLGTPNKRVWRLV